MPYSLQLALAAAAVMLVATPLAMRFAVRIGALAQPGERRIHSAPVPTLGGLAMIAAVLAVAWTSRVLPGAAATLDPMPLLGLTLATIPIAILGVWDDTRGASPWTKLLVQSGAALVLVWFGFGIPLFTNPLTGESVASGVWNAPLTVLWVVAVINAINLIDGLDGLASGVVLIAAATLWWVGRSHADFYVMFICSLLIGTTIGFLRFNFPPLLENRKGTATVALLFPLVALAVPLVDSVLAFVRRASSGTHVFGGDADHIHHRLLRLGLSQRGVLLVLWGLCALCGLAAAVLSAYPRGTVVAAVVALAVLLFVAFQIVENLDRRKARQAGPNG
jgi:UDP-GlcNAc:undecaprenyl-phosphate GlcNAc-1-phosphate transferase